MARKKIPDSVLTELFSCSARRCALCFGINNDFAEKKGQVAHVDKNHSNDNLDNLVWLCLDHHDRYDSKTSQTKNYSQHELKTYRNKLYNTVSESRSTPDTCELKSEHSIIEEVLTQLFQFFPYVNLRSYINDFPEYFSLDIVGIIDTWENFKRSNPHIYPFKDNQLNNKLETFFFTQGQLEWIIGSISSGIPTFICNNVRNPMFRLNPALPYEERDEILTYTHELKTKYEQEHIALTNYLRNSYSNTNINSWKR